MKPLHVKTPVIFSQKLKNEWNKSVFFKLDMLQPPGSFKIRGIGRLCQHSVAQGRTQFVASSGGNAGIAVAYCGQQLNIPTTIFIPNTSHPIYLRAIESYGAQVRVAGTVWDEAHQAAQAYAAEHEAAYIPPFDHPLIWAGHATIIDELVADGLKPDVILVAVGGGGLACGLLEGMHQHGWQDVPLIGVQTQGADAFTRSLQAQHIVTLDKVTSRATSLGVKRITNKLWEWCQHHHIQSVVVTDDRAEQGARAFAKDKRLLVELSSGAPLSLVYEQHPLLQDYQTIMVIVCGGINTTFFEIA